MLFTGQVASLPLGDRQVVVAQCVLRLVKTLRRNRQGSEKTRALLLDWDGGSVSDGQSPGAVAQVGVESFAKFRNAILFRAAQAVRKALQPG